MKNYLKYIVALVLSLPLAAEAETIAVEAGTLPAAGIDPEARTLVLTGQVNAADLSYVAMTARSLDLLDLSGAEIVAYKGAPLAANQTSAPAGTLPAYALSGLKAKRVILPAGLEAIGEGALMGSAIESIEIPATVKSIGRGAFAACTALRSLTVPATVETLGSHLCDGCTGLTEIDFGPSDIPEAAFRGCTALSSVSLPASLRAIGDEAFLGCASLNRLAVPPALVSIGAAAFERSGLERMQLSYCQDLASIGPRAFSLCPGLTTVSLPATVRLGEAVFFDSPNLTTLLLPAALDELPQLSLKGATGIADADKLLPPTVRTLGPMAMAGMSNAKSIALPPDLSYIGDNAFEGWTGVTQIDARELSDVPALGSDVWAGVDQPNVALRVKPDLVNAFIAAPQWKEFNISESGSTLIRDNMVRGSFRVRFEGTVLEVKSMVPVKSALLAELDGTVVARLDASEPVESFRFDTSSRHDRFFVLAMEFEDGSETSVKLLRP